MGLVAMLLISVMACAFAGRSATNCMGDRAHNGAALGAGTAVNVSKEVCGLDDNEVNTTQKESCR